MDKELERQTVGQIFLLVAVRQDRAIYHAGFHREILSKAIGLQLPKLLWVANICRIARFG